MPVFREAGVADDDALALLTEYFSARAESFPAGPEAYRTVFPSPDDFVPPRGVFLIVEGEDLAGDAADVGCGGIRRISPSETGAARFEVKHLYVQPHTRGSGLGGALLAELERRAVELGADEVVLDTNASLESAARLYSKAGYQTIEPYNDNPNANNWYGKVVRDAAQ
ncbi:GNAT family N-acetyltransferase [Salinibacterium sp. dk2585]|uniref:GNAT family N-acetyltransferase n=1 Tax=unclassified Salinibacterium TaxID=2632331 RepID=UPI0011C24867|nr:MULTISPECIES: GNAT family N-acetyltransferase [unclassified Salinibacterium]QEE61670.1 GNAT family N-acetyltransferase [Salinibacterium sp. dk2585]TXK54778.1 GNAT family N-acetyltransferase [Salinibacterium sp. dk5596]